MNIENADFEEHLDSKYSKMVEQFSEQSREICKKYSKDQNEQKNNNSIPRNCFRKSKKLQSPEQLPQVDYQDKTINVRSKPRIKSSSKNKQLSEFRKKVQRNAQKQEKWIKKQFELKLSKSKVKKNLQLYHLNELEKIQNSSKYDHKAFSSRKKNQSYKKILLPAKSQEMINRQKIPTNKVFNQSSSNKLNQKNIGSEARRSHSFYEKEMNNSFSQRIQERGMNIKSGLSINMRICNEKQCYLASIFSKQTSKWVTSSKKVQLNVVFDQSQNFNVMRCENVRGLNAQRFSRKPALPFEINQIQQQLQFQNSEINQDFQVSNIYSRRNEDWDDKHTQKSLLFQRQNSFLDHAFRNIREFEMQSFNSVRTYKVQSKDRKSARFNNSRHQNQSSNSLSGYYDNSDRKSNAKNNEGINKSKNQRKDSNKSFSSAIIHNVKKGLNDSDRFDNDGNNQNQSYPFKQGHSHQDQNKHENSQNEKVPSSPSILNQSKFQCNYQPPNFPDSRLKQTKSKMLKDEEYQFNRQKLKRNSERSNLRKSQHVNSGEGSYED